ncbi:DNA polymerase III subunit beta [Peribacillus simplex]|uniref:DNA polymerase III subunit beta n=1 Tax=Peribacillus TaxID=2675229 RepID=UPI00178502E1|nr:DNA polymerase III subunit beta [Brevibacillus sp. JNUCC-41]QOS88864.1 DNA polymerase III subunit beta [Brevibacillus sp. JNUCC-41]
MEFIINKECFNKAITDVSHAVSIKTHIPILSGIKIVANSDCLTLLGGNSDIVIEKNIPLTIDGVMKLEVFKKGTVVLSAKYLSEIVKKSPDVIHVKMNENQSVTIQSNEIVTNLNGLHSGEYPNLPQVEEAGYFNIPSVELLEIIKQTVFAVSKSGVRPALTGVNLSIKDNKLSCVATNSHRLALRELPLESKVNGSFTVPSKCLNELTKLINNEAGIIHIFITKSYIVFKANTISLYSRLIEGNYPNVSGLLPQDLKTIITMDTNALLKGIDRACLFASEWRNNNVHLEILDNSKLRISSNSSELGKIEETQSIKAIRGDAGLSISLDGSFLLDALKAIKEKEVKLSFGGPMKPILIEPSDNSSYLHLISPVRTY